ncbi:MAG TPA: hypothetical protein VN924_09110 [Bryobacteraceae bacterium]|nr:hypothetical protein [Bryobacteraceae bacterium]
MAALALVLFFTVCHRWLETPLWSFNGSRLMPSFALARGVNYYVLSPPGGPLYNSLYGPLVAVIYLPATLFHSPNSAVLAGSAITIVLCFSAAAFLHFAPFKPGRGPVDGLAFLTAGFLMCYLEPLKYSCFNIHADGPGLAFSAVACAALCYRGPEKWRAGLPVSALCAVLSIFCKQTFLPVPFALLIYLWAVEGRAQAVRYLLWLMVVGALAGGAAMFAAGPANLYHCLIWVPAHHPWNDSSHIVSAIQAMRSFIRVSMPVPVLLLACAVYLWTSGRLRGPELRALAANRGVPILLVGIALLPFSIGGRAKAGGDVNSLSFSLFFLTCGLTVMLADSWRSAQSRSARRVAVSVLVACILPLAISEAPLALDIRASARRVPHAAQAAAFDYLNRHPGGAYFPWFPIAHYYAEREFRHYAFGIVDRLLAGEPVSGAEFQAYVPRNPAVIAFAADGTRELFGYDLMNYMPEYSRLVNDPELPGWLVYTRAPR